jgi:predicted RNA-binding protein with TRAM domain|tara:strand:- start:217 stop:591 length:375 start_codon:yes stop_codon:yes gene_type:complete
MDGMNDGGFGPQRSFTAPVKVGDEIDVKIEAVGEKGDGIAKEKGFVLFIPNTKEGDEVKVKVTKVLRRVGFAEVVGEASGQVKQEEAAPAQAEQAQEPQEEASEEPAEDNSQDSEDFGEEENKE